MIKEQFVVFMPTVHITAMYKVGSISALAGGNSLYLGNMEEEENMCAVSPKNVDKAKKAPKRWQDEY